MLVNILTCAFNLLIRKSPEAETLMLAKIKMLCFSSYTMYPYLTFQRPSNSNNNESLLFLFNDLWKVKAKYKVLCLNCLAKFCNAKGPSYHPALVGNTWLLVACISRTKNSKRVVISQFQVICATRDAVVTREMSLEKNVDLKSI